MTARALVVIDMLRDFIEPDGALTCGPAGRAVVPEVAAVLAEARRSGDAVLFVCDRHLPDDPEFRVWPAHCVAGTEGAEVVAELAPRPGERIVPKRRYSGFFGTDLDLALRERGVRELTLAGVCTNICVLYTAADARMRGYEVAVPRAAVASFDQRSHEWALVELERTLGARLT
jgi:nicotinamidase/pyrazinamidase